MENIVVENGTLYLRCKNNTRNYDFESLNHNAQVLTKINFVSINFFFFFFSFFLPFGSGTNEDCASDAPSNTTNCASTTTSTITTATGSMPVMPHPNQSSLTSSLMTVSNTSIENTYVVSGKN